MRDLFTLLGYLAGTLTTLSFLPQVLHTYRVKSVADFSWKMLIAFNCGLALWFVYGVFLRSWPMILANGISLGLQAFIIGMKIRYER
jgi:MtN3 and saliva related transmembrane protein